MTRYTRSYDHTDAPGWTGGGIYAGLGYRTSGYRVPGRPEQSTRYDRPIARPPRHRVRRGYEWQIQPRGLGFPRYGPQHRGAARTDYATDYYGGGYGPSYYTGGLYGRELARGRSR